MVGSKQQRDRYSRIVRRMKEPLKPAVPTKCSKGHSAPVRSGKNATGTVFSFGTGEVQESLRALLDNNPSLVFLKDESGRYVYLNSAYEKQFVHCADWHGKTDFDFWPKESAELFREHDNEVLRSGRTQRFLEDSKDKEGKRYCWLCYKFSFTDSYGDRFIGGIGIDTTDRILAEEALQRHETRQAFIVKLSDALRQAAEPAVLQDIACTLLCEHLHAGRVHYEEHRESPADHSTLTGFGEIRQKLLKGGVLAIADSEKDPLLSEPARALCRTLGIRSFIIAPQIMTGEPVQTLNISCAAPREWTPDDVALVREVGGRAWDAIEHARTSAALRESENKYRTLFETMDEGYALCRLERDGS